jgi:F0F1-type ATP synthase membrane subunit b/b'
LQFEAFAAAKHAEAEAFVKEQLQQAHKALSKEFEEASVEAKKRIEEEAQRVYSSLFKKEVSQALDAMGNESEQRIKVRQSSCYCC